MPQASNGGSLVTGASVVDNSLSAADFDASTKPSYFVTEAKSMIPDAVFPLDSDNQDGQIAITMVTNTSMKLGLLKVNAPITINKVSFRAVTVNVAGTFKIACYSEDGQTKHYEETTATVSAGGVVTTTLSAAVRLPAGNYYFALLPVGTASVDIICHYRTSQNHSDMVSDGVAGKPVLVGTVTVTASTIPSTITPGSITAAAPCPLVRLDN